MFKVDSAGNLVRENGRFVRVEGLEAVRQHVQIRLGLWKREVAMDRSRGMNLLGGILTKGTPLAEIEGEISGQILDTPGVVEVTDLSSDFDATTRRLTVDYRALVSLDDQRERLPLFDQISIPL